MTTLLQDRFAALPAASPADRLVGRDGSLADYAALGEFHYLAHKPGTATRVLVLDDPHPPIASRFVGSGATPQSEAWGVRSSMITRPSHTARPSRAVWHPKSESHPVAVLVESYPSLSCVLRNHATGGRYTGWSDRRAAGRLLNAEVRCISRVVVHPQWRGLGLAVRLVRHALATATTPYTEALASMGRVHPFFERAGMTAYRRHPHARDQRLLDAMRCAGIEPWELASERLIRKRLVESELLRRELRRWAGAKLTVDEQIAKARSHLLCEPVYYIRKN